MCLDNFFEGDNGAVYRDQTLTADLTIPEGKTLTIPEGVALTNNGTLYVDGALSGTVGGNVYYRLALIYCTATGSPSLVTYDGKTYATAGTNVSLTATLSDNQLVTGWQVQDVEGIPSGSVYTISSMPAKPVTATATLANALTIDTQPTGGTITYGDGKTLSVEVSKHNSVTGDLTYQWYESSTAIDGVTSSSYTTPADLTAENHTYYCVITCGTYTITSGNATVKVNPLAEATPVIAIDYENETMTGFVTGSSYTIDGTAVTPALRLGTAQRKAVSLLPPALH